MAHRLRPMRLGIAMLGLLAVSTLAIGAATRTASTSQADFDAFLPSDQDLSTEFDYYLDEARDVTTRDVAVVIPEEFVSGRYQRFFLDADLTLDVRAPVGISVWCLRYETEVNAHIAMVADYLRLRLAVATANDELPIEQIADEALANGGLTRGEDHGARVWFRDGQVFCRFTGIGNFYDPLKETFALASLTADRLAAASTQ